MTRNIVVPRAFAWHKMAIEVHEDITLARRAEQMPLLTGTAFGALLSGHRLQNSRDRVVGEHGSRHTSW